MTQMRAKFRGRCQHCGQSIVIGEVIAFSKATGAIHDVCSQRMDTLEAGHRAGERERWHPSRPDANSASWARAGYGDGDL